MGLATVFFLVVVMSLASDMRSSYAQTQETPPEKVLQLAKDFCSQVTHSQQSSDVNANKTTQLAKDFCSQVSSAQSSSEPTRLALAKPGEPTRLALAEGPGQQSTVASGPDWSLSVGYKMWLNTWQQGFVSIPKLGTGVNIRVADAFALGSIPNAVLRYKDFFISSSAMFTPEYDFKSQSVTGQVAGIPFTTRLKTRGSRVDTDVTLGYYIHPSIALLTGYKGVYQHLDTESSIPFPSALNPGKHVQLNYHGITFGASIGVPIPAAGWLPSGFALYATGAGGPMWFNSNNSKIVKDITAIYGTIDAGITYRTPALPLSFSLGYKYQLISNKLHDPGFSGQSGNDTTSGAILGINYTF